VDWPTRECPARGRGGKPGIPEVPASSREGPAMALPPKPPYYYRAEGSDTYHWEKSCSRNHYPAPGWKVSNTKPSGRKQCTECKTK
jgi:hypothetical protein